MDKNAHITATALRRYLGLEPPLPVVEHLEITDNVLRKYLGLDAYNPQQPRDENGRWTSSNNGVVKISKEEYHHIVHELNNNLTNAEFKRGKTVRFIGNYGYKVVINGFNEYQIKDRWLIDGNY